MAIDENIPAQKVDYAKLRARLLAEKQVLDWTKDVDGLQGKLSGAASQAKTVIEKELSSIKEQHPQAFAREFDYPGLVLPMPVILGAR